ncbi:hypothetical protein PQX77_007995 [Marasmius sp. AFHP31]|nr:hypothetical protein PQX77_007995 [Marasmius sp. AFHP31]
MQALRLWGPNLAASNGEQWRKHRRVMGPAFNAKLYSVVWKKTQDIYHEMVSTGEWKKDEINLEPLALIILGSCGFGLPGSWSEPPRTQDDDPKAMTVQGALRIVADTVALTLFTPGWVKSLPFKTLVLLLMMFSEVTQNQSNHRIQDSQRAYRQLSTFMKEQIALRKSSVNFESGVDQSDESVGRNNVLTLLVQASENEESRYQLDDDELIGNVFLLLLAGHETTANALAGTFGFLAAHPAVQQEIHDHIVEVVGYKRDPTFEDYNSLNKVMSAFIEAVRFFPGGHVLIREANEDTILDIPADPKTGKDKEFIPLRKGVQVVVDMIGIHRNPRYFEAPEEYRPSRWYNVPNDSDLFTGFSFGPRSCIGRKFATVEAVCWLTMILRDWEVRPSLKKGETESDWARRNPIPNFSMTLGVGDIALRFVRRSKK